MPRQSLFACVAIPCLLHCSGSTGATADAGAGDAGPSVGDATPNTGAGDATPYDDARDEGQAADGGAGADCGTGGANPLILLAYGGPSGEVAAEVTFPEPGVGPQDTCNTPVVAGACQLTTCQVGAIGSPSGAYGNFGPITASVGTTTVALTYDQGGYGSTYFPSSITLGTGGTMTFRGGNACGVPAFDVPVTIPGVAVITSPVPTDADGGAAIIDTTQPLSVTWSSIAIGQVHFTLEGGSEQVGGTTASLVCTFDGTAGSGVVPQTLLSSLKTTSGTNPVYGDLASELDTTTVVDGLTIETQSHQNSPTADRSFSVTLQ